MNKQEHIQIIDSGEIDLGKLFGLIWKKKVQILAIIFFTGTISFISSNFLTVQYQSSAIIVERNSSGTSPLSEFSGIASITGINLPSMPSNISDIAVEKVKSRAFFKELMTSKGLISNLLAADGYDPSNGEIIFDRDMFNPDNGKWSLNYFASGEPSYLYAHEVYLKNLSISKDKINGFVTVSYEHVSPEFAYEFVTLIIHQINESFRIKDKTKSKNSIQYLKNELEKAANQTVRNSISNLIEAEMEVQMRADIYENYLFDFIEEPYIPEKRSWPSKKLISVIGVLIGIFLSLIFVLVSNFRLRSKSSAQLDIK